MGISEICSDMVLVDEFRGLMSIQELRIGSCPVFLELCLLNISILFSGVIFKLLFHWLQLKIQRDALRICLNTWLDNLLLLDISFLMDLLSVSGTT
jgi:hypothetical protein